MRRSTGGSERGLRIGVYALLCVGFAATGWVGAAAAFPRSDAMPTAVAFVPTPTPNPTAEATPTREFTPEPSPTPTPEPTPTATPSPTPLPTRAPMSMDVYRPNTFVSQLTKESCMAGAVQNMLNIIGPKIDLDPKRQQALLTELKSLTTKDDSHNGGMGPAAWALAMPKLGAGRYKLVVDPSLEAALRDGAIALRKTGRPVGLLAWKGAHSWVMTGFRSDADPALFPATFKLTGAFIVDPFYPRKSSIWGQTVGPDTFRDMAAMAKNYLPWKRPEGKYPERDGKFLLVVPVR